jgi:hypothetical protein
MAIEYVRDVIASGYNLSKINDNFAKIEQALQDALSRSGEGPNAMASDLDMNSNDLLNVNIINAEELWVDGHRLTPEATVDTTNFATAAQGGRADSALQPQDAPASVYNLGTLVSAAAQTSKDIFIPAGSWSVNDDLTFPKGLKVVVERGAQITVAATKTLTFNCLFEAPLSRVFFGSGTVVGIRNPRPEWWGAVADYNGVTGTDNAPAINAAVNCAQNSQGSDGENFPFVKLSVGLYAIDSTIILQPTNGSPIGMKGCGTMLGSSGGSRICSRMATGIAFHVQGLYGPLDNNRLGLFYLEDFVIQDNYGATNTTVGLMIGSETATLLDSAPTNNRVVRVSVYGFQGDWLIVNARNIVFEDCSGQTPSRADATALEFRISNGGGFCGECVIMGANSVFQTTPGIGRPLKFSVDDPGVNAELRGIKFMTGTFYGGEKKVGMYAASSNAANRSYIGHIWFSSGVQLDAGGTSSSIGVEMLATGASAFIEEITFEKTYMAGIIDHVIYAQVLSNGTGFGNIVAINVEGCKFNYIINRIGTFEGGLGINFRDCWLYDCGTSVGGGPTTATSWFYFNQTNTFSVSGIKRVVPPPDAAIWDGGTITTGVLIQGGASNYYTVRNNAFKVATPVNDTVAAVNRDVAANW